MSAEGLMIDLNSVAQIALQQAQKLGLDQAEVSLHQGTGVSVAVRQQELETVEKHNDAQIVVSVFKDHKTGSASSADLTENGVQSVVEAAASIAGYTGEDKCLGLADANLMATDLSDLDLYHPWPAEVSEMTEIALQCEQYALQSDARISNSEGASINSYAGNTVYANSHGFNSDVKSSQHSLSCTMIASNSSGMQRDYWYDSNCNHKLLESAQSIGQTAAKRSVQRLDARQLKSQQCPVLFDPVMAKSLIGHMVAGIKGSPIYKKASFLLGKLDHQIMPEFVSISENPHLLGGAGSAKHDNEGVATPAHSELVADGNLQRYVLGSYTARKLGLKSTANAGGVRNLVVSDSGQDFSQLLQSMGSGILVTELIGSGINMVSGDYSRGAAGFWVENGEILFPVEEITIAGNLLDMFRGIAAIGTDTDLRGNTRCGSILIENMTVAGS